MAVGAAVLGLVVALAGSDSPVTQKAGYWEIHTAITAYVGESHLLDAVSATARMHMPLITRTVDEEATTESVFQACWSDATAQANQVPDPALAITTLRADLADLPCVEPEHTPNIAVLQCDFGGGITATRSLTQSSNTPDGFEVADDMVLKRGDTQTVVLHWRIAEKATWIGPHCDR